MPTQNHVIIVKKLVITIEAYVLLFHLKYQLQLKQQLLINHLLVPMIAANQLLLNQQLITVIPAVNTDHMLLTSGEWVLLQTAIVPVCCADGSNISARILLDSASQRTFMTERLAKQLNLPSQRKEMLSISTFGSKGPQSIDTYVVHFTIITKESSRVSLHANVLNQITSPVQRGPLHQSDLEFLQSITPGKLADIIPKSPEMATIDILVGSDYVWSIVEVGRIVLPSGLLLLSSKLGYLLTGKFMDPKSEVKPNDQLSTCFVMTQMNQSVHELNLFSTADTAVNKNPSLKDLRSLDAIGICDPAYLNDNDETLEQFNNTICCDGERYQIAWPWKPCEPDLPENYDVAYGRIRSLS